RGCAPGMRGFAIDSMPRLLSPPRTDLSVIVAEPAGSLTRRMPGGRIVDYATARSWRLERIEGGAVALASAGAGHAPRDRRGATRRRLRPLPGRCRRAIRGRQ